MEITMPFHCLVQFNLNVELVSRKPRQVDSSKFRCGYVIQLDIMLPTRRRTDVEPNSIIIIIIIIGATSKLMIVAVCIRTHTSCNNNLI